MMMHGLTKFKPCFRLFSHFFLYSLSTTQLSIQQSDCRLFSSYLSQLNSRPISLQVSYWHS